LPPYSNAGWRVVIGLVPCTSLDRLALLYHLRLEYAIVNKTKILLQYKTAKFEGLEMWKKVKKELHRICTEYQ